MGSYVSKMAQMHTFAQSRFGSSFFQKHTKIHIFVQFCETLHFVRHFQTIHTLWRIGRPTDGIQNRLPLLNLLLLEGLDGKLHNACQCPVVDSPPYLVFSNKVDLLTIYTLALHDDAMLYQCLYWHDWQCNTLLMPLSIGLMMRCSTNDMMLNVDWWCDAQCGLKIWCPMLIVNAMLCSAWECTQNDGILPKLER